MAKTTPPLPKPMDRIRSYVTTLFKLSDGEDVMLTFDRFSAETYDRITFEARALVLAGWTGRDPAALRLHIEELANLGVPRPTSVPIFYRASAANITQAERVEVLGPDTSGEAEPVVVGCADGLWLGLGSDHTDRKAETIMGVAASKQLCPKPLARTLWRLDEVAPRWDRIILRSYATIDGARMLYQEGTLAAMRTPADLISRLALDSRGLVPGTVLFCGTLNAISGIRPASRFEMELEDPTSGRKISHAYDITVLQIVS
ncbi:MAG TPA: DUF2848 domain-containing protein [Pseudolabrys sp.]|nr:DUF2848 domain-containing protein [Pseudolabrys sp.]